LILASDSELSTKPIPFFGRFKDMSLARQNARKFLSLEQVCLVEEIFDDRQLRTHIFELLFDYSENAGTPEYQNWRLLLDEIGKFFCK